MPIVDVDNLLWDNWNRVHIVKHGVMETEVYEAMRDANIQFKDGHSDRLLAFGRSGKRLLTVVLGPEENDKYYVVTVRDASKPERRYYYDQEKKQNSKV